MAEQMIALEPEARDILTLRSEIAKPVLTRMLSEAGHRVRSVVAYRTVGVPVTDRIAEDVRSGRINAILVTSGSVAEQVHAQFPEVPADDPHRRDRPAHREGRPARRAVGRRDRRRADGRRAHRRRRPVPAAARGGRIRSVTGGRPAGSSSSPAGSADRASRSASARALRARGIADTAAALTVVVNTGDDLWLSGVRLQPDVDSIVYALAGVNDARARLGARGRHRARQPRAAGVGRGLAVVHPRRPRPRHAPRPHRLAARGPHAHAGDRADVAPLAARSAPAAHDRRRGRHDRRAAGRLAPALPGVVDAPPRDARAGAVREPGHRGRGARRPASSRRSPRPTSC